MNDEQKQWLEVLFGTAISAWNAGNIRARYRPLFEYYYKLENSNFLIYQDWGKTFFETRYLFYRKFGFPIDESTLVAVFMTVMKRRCFLNCR